MKKDKTKTKEVTEPVQADILPSGLEGLKEFMPTQEERDELNEQSDSDPDYLEYSSEAVGFENREQQWETYRIIANYIGKEDSVLDFGCARGDFDRFFNSEFDVPLNYIGVDMNQQLINAGMKVYNGEVELLCNDWFNLDKNVKQDWAVNIGSSNLRYDADTSRDDMTYLQDTIKSMMQHCEKGSIVLLASMIGGTDDGLINWDPGEVLNWAQKEFGLVALDHTFSNDIFTLIIYKN